jgi:hypothetical protein
MKPLNWKISDGEGLIHLVAGLTKEESEPYDHMTTHRVLFTATKDRYALHIGDGNRTVLMCCGIWLTLHPRSAEKGRATCLMCLGS